MSIVESILVFGVIPLAFYGLVSALTLRHKFAGSSRYRPGQEWNYPPVWWTANPHGVGESHSTVLRQESGETQAARGGASGSW